MGWADIKRRYETEGLNTQSTEDMVARRILRAVGLTVDKLYKFEKYNGLLRDREEDTTLLERAIKAAQVVSDAFYNVPPIREVTSFKQADHALQCYTECLPDSAVLIYRLGKCEPRALMRLPKQLDTDTLVVPCHIAKSNECDSLLADCDAGDYFMKIANGKVAKDEF